MEIKAKSKKLLNLIQDKNFVGFFVKAIISFSGGIIAAVPYFLGSFSPFAASLPAALNSQFSIICAVGSVLGIFVFQSGISAFRYFATVITSTVILHICTHYFGLKNENILRPVCPAFCSMAVNCIFLFSQKISADLIISALTETAITTLCVPVFFIGARCIKTKHFIPEELSLKQLACLLFSLTALLGQLRGIGVLGNFVASTFFFSEILFFALRKSYFAAALSSAFSSLVYAMGGEADFMCAVLASCGLICALTDNKRPYIAGIICFLSAFIGCSFGEYTDYLPVLPAAAVAGAIFSFIPYNIIIRGVATNQKPVPDPVAIPLQAKEISKAVENLGDCVNAVRKTLKPLTAPDLSKVLYRATQKVCNQCELKESCINQLRKQDNPFYSKAADSIKNQPVDISIFPDDFTQTCYCHNEVITSMNQAYFIHCANVDSDNKISKFQEITGNQLKSFGSIISNICTSAVNGGAITSKSSAVCTACAESFGIEIINTRLCTNKAGHEYFNLSFLKPEENFNVTQLTKNLCRETGFELDFPTLVQKDDVYTLIFKQKSKVNFKIAAAMKPATKNGVSGDYYRSFTDSFNRQIVLLSDGMGTGSRAAIDSAFTCETFCNLLKSGLDVKTTASTVNCAMLMKSTDESLATVDLIIADPVLSTVKFYKCGAAPTFILQKGKTFVIEAESVPIGILDTVDLAESEISVEKGDIILTVSDGVAGENWGWISSELKHYRGENPAVLARHILQCAGDRHLGKRADDMTVIAVMVDERLDKADGI